MSELRSKSYETPKKNKRVDITDGHPRSTVLNNYNNSSNDESERQDMEYRNSKRPTFKRKQEKESKRELILTNAKGIKRRFPLFRDVDFGIDRENQIKIHSVKYDDDYMTDDDQVTSSAFYCLAQLKEGVEAEFGKEAKDILKDIVKTLAPVSQDISDISPLNSEPDDSDNEYHHRNTSYSDQQDSGEEGINSRILPEGINERIDQVIVRTLNRSQIRTKAYKRKK